jgi:hypothetical protein
MLVRAHIPDPAAIRTGRAMSMPRLDSRSPSATGVPSASGTVLPGACAACAFAADQVAAVSVARGATKLRPLWPCSGQVRAAAQYVAMGQEPSHGVMAPPIAAPALNLSGL